MQRILVIGSSGSGKSTLARAIGARLGLPVVHLDRHYWRPGWVEPDAETWGAQVDALLEADAWVMDGNYGGTMDRRLEAADAVVFLDRSRWLCLWRVVWRRIRFARRTRPDMGEGCPERLNAPFLHYVFGYPTSRRPGVLARLAAAEARGVRVARLQSGRAVRDFVASL
ncbi:MAG: AAA family ATPase [Bacteroidota bacterium]